MSIYRPLTGLELGDVWMIARACYEAAHAADVAARGSASRSFLTGCAGQ